MTEHSKEFRKIMYDASKEAQKRGQSAISPEHVLLALCDDNSVLNIFRTLKIEASAVEAAVCDFFEKRYPEASQPLPARPTEQTPELKKILKLADERDLNSLESLTILRAIGQSTTQAGLILSQMGINKRLTQADITPQQSSGRIDPAVAVLTPDRPAGYDVFTGKSDKDFKNNSAIAEEKFDQHENEFCKNLTRLAREGKIEKAIGRDFEIEEVMDTLQRYKKPNALLVGEAGVGKTAIAKGLAWLIAHDEVPDELKGKNIYSINAAMLEAGTMYRGMFEEKFGRFLEDISKDPDAILFIDEVHTMIGLGGTSTGGLDAFNMLKPYMSEGDLRIIAATTYKESKHIVKDEAVARRFETIKIDEPGIDTALKIVSQSIAPYAKRHNVEYSKKALRAATLLSERYITGFQMPDKVFDVLDKAGVLRKKKARADGKPATVTVRDIETIIARRTGLPVSSLRKSEVEKLLGLDPAMRREIVGQEEVITALCDTARMACSKLRDPDKPSSFLFNGPTGVGKTEAAKILAQLLDMNFIRLDMSEMQEAHSVSKLIGAPPGYVGFDQGGILTEAIRQKPYSVLLLDEADKAHPDVLTVMLQAMDRGTLTDSEGNPADFRNTIIIMTTNAGVSSITNVMGFTNAGSSKKEQISENAKKFFTPEFRNRFNKEITFNHLTKEHMPFIADKFIKVAQERMKNEDLTLDFRESAMQWLIENGFDPEMGARPMKHMVEEHILIPINNASLRGKAKKRGTISVTFNEAAAKPEDESKTILSFDFINPVPKERALKVA